MRQLARAALVMLLALAGCATPRVGSPVLADDAPAPRADLYVFNVSRGTLIPLKRHVTVDGFPLVSLRRETWRKLAIKPGTRELVLSGRRLMLAATDGGTYYLAVGFRPRREWLMPIAADPIFIRVISEAEALRLFTEMKPDE